MKKIYNISNKKNGNLLMTLTFYDKKVEKQTLKQFQKLKKFINICEVDSCEKKI